MSNTVSISITEVHRLSSGILEAVGVPADHAVIVADSIVHAHRKGKGTHGLTRLPIYVRKIRDGLMAADTPITVVRDTPVVSVIDANHGFGQVAGVKAMEIAVRKAGEFGVGVVGVRKSNNFGVAGFIVEAAISQGMIGLVLANSGPAIAPTGGSTPLLGTNPLAIGFPPGESGIPIILDMATSAAARGKIRLAARNGESIPLGWALDKDGNPTTDSKAALEGTMLPLGGPKGYGLSLAIDILAGLLTGAAFAGDVKGLNDPSDFSNYGHLIAAIHIEHFTTPADFREGITLLESRIRECGPPDAVFMPGEKSYHTAQSLVNSVEVKASVLDEIRILAKVLGLPFEKA